MNPYLAKSHSAYDSIEILIYTHTVLKSRLSQKRSVGYLENKQADNKGRY